MGMSKEQEVTHHFTVEVTTFGKETASRVQVLKELHRGLYARFGRKYVVRVGGVEVGWDHLGDDMGHHPGHAEGLVVKNKEDRAALFGESAPIEGLFNGES